MVPLKITCRNFPITDTIRGNVRTLLERMEKMYDRILRCEVEISTPHRHQHKGRIFHVAVRLVVPGPNLVVNREAEEDPKHEQLHLAINHAFHAMERQLEDRVREARGFVKNHAGPPEGRVLRVFPERGYGFLESDTGEEVYFHENSVLNGKFPQLTVGTRVRFHMEQGEKGPQASSLQVMRLASAQESVA